MHNKTYMAAIGWLISVGGWFLWTVALSAVFKPNKTFPLYPMYRDFIDLYGRDFAWWLVLFLTLATLVLFELGVSSVRKTFWPTDTDVFQELQKDPIIRNRFEETVLREAEGGVVEMGREENKKTSEEIMREGEIQELLSRPRVMDGVEAVDFGALSRNARGSLHRRRISTDVVSPVEIEMGTRSPSKTFRRSVDIAEVLGGKA
jgi:phospholipid-translocating ATPase